MKTLLPEHLSSGSERGSLQHPILNAIIEADSKRLLKAKHLSLKHAAINQPPEDNANLNDYLAPIYNEYEMAIPQIKAELNGDMQIALGSIKKNSSLKRNQQLATKLANKEEERDIQASQLPYKISFSPLYTFIFSCLIVSLIYVGEINYLATSLQILCSSFNKALILSVGISTGLLVISHLAPIYIDMISNPTIRKILRSIVILIIVITFYIIGELRADYLEKMGQKGYSGLSFIAINSILFIAIFLIAYFLIVPNWIKVRQIIDYLKQKSKVKRLERDIIKLESEVDANKDDLELDLIGRLETIHLAEACKKLLTTLYNRAVSEYINENSLKRGFRVPCLSQEPKHLDFSNLLQTPKKNETSN
ncbi:MAG: hypothetical protein SGJ00_11340 [bacterium]|nr:hypothetical protein [bacterium]